MIVAMADSSFSVLVTGGADASWSTSAIGPFEVSHAVGLDGAVRFDAVVCAADTAQDLRNLVRRADLQQAAFDAALVVLTPASDALAELTLLQMGVQDIVNTREPEVIARAIRHAIERKRLEQVARTAYATDLATGLPHQAQLLEHMTQLLALRERDPAPMVLIVLRIEGLASTAARLGGEGRQHPAAQGRGAAARWPARERRRGLDRPRHLRRAARPHRGPRPTASAWRPSWWRRCTSRSR